MVVLLTTLRVEGVFAVLFAEELAELVLLLHHADFAQVRQLFRLALGPGGRGCAVFPAVLALAVLAALEVRPVRFAEPLERTQFLRLRNATR